jgi:hypothetical protein
MITTNSILNNKPIISEDEITGLMTVYSGHSHFYYLDKFESIATCKIVRRSQTQSAADGSRTLNRHLLSKHLRILKRVKD